MFRHIARFCSDVKDKTIDYLALIYYLYGGTVVSLVVASFLYHNTIASHQYPLIAICFVCIAVVAHIFQSTVYYNNWHWHKQSRYYLPIAIFFITWVFIAVQVFWVYEYTVRKDYWQGYISDLTWHYEVQVSRWQAVSDKCWGLSCLPDHAYNASKRREDTGRDDCYEIDDHKYCDDIYDWRWRYTINRLIYNRSYDTVGDWHTKPYYEEISLARLIGDPITCPGTNDAFGPEAKRLGCEQITAHIPRYFYYIKVIEPHDIWNNPVMCDIDNQWFQLSVEQTISGKYYMYRDQLICESTRFVALDKWRESN